MANQTMNRDGYGILRSDNEYNDRERMRNIR